MKIKSLTKLWIIIAIAAIVLIGAAAVVGTTMHNDETITSSYVTGAAYTGTDTSTVDDDAPIVPTTGSATVTFPAQPTALAGNYSGNGAMLRAWASENTRGIDIPANAKNVLITFKLAKMSKNINIPGNIQASIDGKNLCNGRLSAIGAFEDIVVDGTYKYTIDCVTTQDKKGCTDWSKAIGNTLTFKVWIGENKNYVESITIDWTI